MILYGPVAWCVDSLDGELLTKLETGTKFSQSL